MAPEDHFLKSARILGSMAVVIAALYLAKGVLVPLMLAVCAGGAVTSRTQSRLSSCCTSPLCARTGSREYDRARCLDRR
ncbi:hypothetical protein I41_49610 [Lacipirellula limnantheis]|uniref:Uncharacterized protein n=1 Tax=Lacipirellula limnantheis TaxID=2528024 RepID=A0A517U500_9BACT|nr:hypothetical protein I41_49610 [Lacipirellula limnantheis]